MVDLQDKLDSVSPQGTNSLNLDPRDCSPHIADGQISGLRSPQVNGSFERGRLLRKELRGWISRFYSL